MIRKLCKKDKNRVLDIWLNENLKAHGFIDFKFWEDHYNLVGDAMLNSEVYVYENDTTFDIEGFIGMDDGYIAGIFIKDNLKSKGRGRELLDYVKLKKDRLSLHVYKKNKKAVSFYIREGFEVKSVGVDNNTGEEEIYMIWEKLQ